MYVCVESVQLHISSRTMTITLFATHVDFHPNRQLKLPLYFHTETNSNKLKYPSNSSLLKVATPVKKFLTINKILTFTIVLTIDHHSTPTTRIDDLSNVSPLTKMLAGERFSPPFERQNLRANRCWLCAKAQFIFALN